MSRAKKVMTKLIALVLTMSMVFSVMFTNINFADNQTFAENAVIKQTDLAVKNDITKHFDENVMFKLPETVAQESDISIIVDMQTETIMDAFEASGSEGLIKDYVLTDEAKAVASDIVSKQNAYLHALNKAGIKYTLGEKYDTILGGFEITIKASDFSKVGKALPQANLIVGEVYEECKTEVVTNEVDVYETGIFDSSKSQYKGDGVVVAVLDTGLDYTHTAFSANNFSTTTEALTFDKVSEKVRETVAATFTEGLTGEDVYVSKKIPFAYDYADKDPDVLPINSEHGTHVAGVIAGQDDTIIGVAPNAQLAIMKVFSDSTTGAKTSWILSALEDCVILGVDVINMSLGTSCGFTREVDRAHINVVYDKIKEAGISLITAASNDNNATQGSEKNGSNPLTKHPDSGTVGAPSTYEASLSVASVDGVKTPYLLFNDEILYFTEASSNDGKPRDFVSEILSTVGDDVDSHEFEFVTIPGIGRSSDYPHDGDYYAGKIVLVKRGQTTFEDKIRIALKEKGAAGIIIYNNVSGNIMMAVGDNVGAACSISQDQGEMLAAVGTGKLVISKKNEAGPFMSDFSSWGPTSDLKIKPEITAHGGEILSAVPGQAYDRLSGTSMASPNQAGAAALIRQYVKYSGVFGEEEDLDPIAVTDLVNQLVMSTADIVYNKNGLPYAVRKQGAGLVNIYKAQTSASYLTTYDKDGNRMSKTKLELGDDKQRTGVYEMKFDINNISASNVSYDIAALVCTEGVSETYTSHDDTTSTQDGYIFDDATITVLSVTGNGTNDGNSVTVESKKSATVTVKVELSEKDKQYLEKSFQYGMYVEGFVTLTATAGTEVNVNVPFLTFYGDWTEPPIFDEEYYDTHKDEINQGLDVEDKLMADAYATRVVGGMYSDYIGYLGSYYFQQDPALTPIAASKEHIAISNYENGEASSINSIYGIWAGLMRNVKEADIVITEDSTGKVVYTQTEMDIQKSRSAGNSMYSANIDMEYAALANNLRNNTKYTVTVTTYIDYGTKEEQNNARNVFEFPLYIDYSAPVVTGVEYRTEYDKTTKKTKLFADISVYDNHYAMSMQVGQILPEDYDKTGYYFTMNSFGRYFTPIYSSFNSTSKVIVELTDYISDIKNSVKAGYDENGNVLVEKNSNTFIVTCYDYALNAAQYELQLPSDITAMAFTEETINLSPNQTQDLSQMINIFPADSWMQVLNFESSNEDIVSVVNQTLLAKQSGDAEITAVGYDENGNEVRTSMNVHVYAEGEEGYKKYTIPSVNKFEVVGYKTNKAFYQIANEDRDIGLTGSVNDFGSSAVLEMFPSESVTIRYVLDSYFPEKGEVRYSSGNTRIATVDEDGTIVAQAEGNAVINVDFYFDGNRTQYSKRINVAVKDPFTINSIYLMNYQGLGGEVVIPANRGITHIYMYSFSGVEYVEKDLAAGDIIDEEDPYHIKQSAIGENTITKVIIPEGVTHIDESAFEKLTALEEVVLPSTLVTIGAKAFKGCSKLKTINLDNVKFINISAFEGCALDTVNLSSVVAIGNYAFKGCKMKSVELPVTSQSLGVGAFANNALLKSVSFKASKIKVGISVFEGCTSLNSIDINSAVIADYAFYGCQSLLQVRLGKDVAVIGKYAFSGTNVMRFEVDKANTTFNVQENGELLFEGTELIIASPKFDGNKGAVNLPTATVIGTGAFASNSYITSVTAPLVTRVGDYAFAECSALISAKMDKVEEIGDYAFVQTALLSTPNLSNIIEIGDFAFAGAIDDEGNIYSNRITTVNIPSGAIVGDYAFYINTSLQTVKIGEYSIIGKGAFESPISYYTIDNMIAQDYEWTIQNLDNILAQAYKTYTYTAVGPNGETKKYTYYRFNIEEFSLATIETVEIGDNVRIGEFAFSGNTVLSSLTLGNDTIIDSYAFMNARSLDTVDFGKVKFIGDYAFGGESFNDFHKEDGELLYASVVEYVDGEWINVGVKTTSLAPKFEEVDLTNVEYLGEGAFINNEVLTTVTFKDESLISDEKQELIGIGDFAFAECKSLVNIELPSYVTTVGAGAFRSTSITTIDLTNVINLGDLAFSLSKLETVTLREGAGVPYGAFASCTNLTTVNNLNKAKSIGGYAFILTALTSLDLTEVEEIGDFAFKQSAVTSVKFGNKLVSMGQNPFAECELGEFAVEKDVIIGGKVVGKELSSTFDISETIKVIDGVIYQISPNGSYELITYPIKKENISYTVVEGTNRISERAFVNANNLRDVTIASTVEAIGAYAFYGCENLMAVIFKSYYAPYLEEEYDVNYATVENYPVSGSYYGNEGLGIIPYYMWNVTPVNLFYGANFVNHIGHIENKLVMVKPANGQYYDSFVYGQYFDAVVEGNNAAVDATLNVMAMIAQLPTSITLDHQSQVEAIRQAYDMLPSIEQQALVSNYNDLLKAESMIKYLIDRINPDPGPDIDDDVVVETPEQTLPVYALILIIVEGVIILAGAGFAVYWFVIRKRK